MFLGAAPTTGLQVSMPERNTTGRQLFSILFLSFFILNVYPFLVKGKREREREKCVCVCVLTRNREKRKRLSYEVCVCVYWVWKPRTKQHLMNDLAAGLVKKSSELARARGLFFSRERVTYHLIILVERERERVRCPNIGTLCALF